MKRMIQALFLMIATLAPAQGVVGRGRTDLSPAELGIVQAHKAISDKPSEYAGYNLLASALVVRAQETFDATLYAQAEDAVKKSLALSPHNFETEKIQASILLGAHEYPAALELAQVLNKRVPDDPTVYGLLTDAEIELGKYDDAENSATWMLNLRRGNRPADIRASRLRYLFGDLEGAYEMADLAFQSTVPIEVGERASLLAQMGQFRLASRNTDAAEKLLQEALTVFPNYPEAVENLAQLRMAQKRYAESVELCEQLYRGVPRAANLYHLAEAMQLSGREAEAQKAFANFEAKARAEMEHKDNSNRELVFYYADHAHKPEKALDVARREYAWRHDVWTLDEYAWALHVNGQDAEARKQIESALSVGVRDEKLFRHAGEISLRLSDREAAERYLKQSVELNSSDSLPARIELTHSVAVRAVSP